MSTVTSNVLGMIATEQRVRELMPNWMHPALSKFTHRQALGIDGEYRYPRFYPNPRQSGKTEMSRLLLNSWVRIEEDRRLLGN